MAKLFDIEANGLLDTVTKAHCLVIKTTEDGRVYRFNDQPIFIKKDGSFEEGLKFLQSGDDKLVAHNGIKYDIPAIRKLYPWFHVDESRLVDTLVLSRLIYPELWESSKKLIERGQMPPKLGSSHSLEAWGYRLKCHKADYQGGWEEWSQEMEDYCVQDVEVLGKLYAHFLSKNYSQQAINLEHQVAVICARQERFGFLFDTGKAAELWATLVQHKLRLETPLQESFPPRYLPAGKKIVTTKSRRAQCPELGINPNRKLTKKDRAEGKVYYKTFDFEEGTEYQKVKLTEFNPGSRDHIAIWLKRKYAWTPTEFTNDGKPKLDDEVLSKLPFPEAKLLGEYLMVDKRIGQLATGDKAWLKLVRSNGRLHGSLITNGAVTGRATHSDPNLGQVPAVKSPYGKECRSLYVVPKGKSLVGADLSGLELRCLAHFMARWDAGAYAKVLLEGDIHTENQKAAGLPTRDNAKTFIYGFLYGAGDAKIGKIVGKSSKVGRDLRQRFLKGLPALGKLVDAVQKAADRGHLVGLDGRLVKVRSKHSALNTLLQGAGALIAKQWLVEFDRMVALRGWSSRAQQVAWVHDEIQVECDEEIADEVGKLAVEAARKAGEFFGFRIPTDAEYRVGRNWAETH